MKLRQAKKLADPAIDWELFGRDDGTWKRSTLARALARMYRWYGRRVK